MPPSRYLNRTGQTQAASALLTSEQNQQPPVGVVVLTRNGRMDTVECLESLFQIKSTNVTVVVVDNGSTDSSVESIRRWARREIPVNTLRIQHNGALQPLDIVELTLSDNARAEGERLRHNNKIALIKAGRNLGVPAGINVGIRYLLSRGVRYVMTLDNDVVITKDALNTMLQALESNKSIGVVGPRVLNYTDGLYAQWPVAMRPTFGTMISRTASRWMFIKRSPLQAELYYKGLSNRPVYAVGGCCRLFRANDLVAMGLLDERAYLFWEECIIAEQLSGLGKHCYAALDAIVYHKGRMKSLLPGYRIFIESTRSEGYFTSRYLNLPRFQRVILMLGRRALYLARSLRDRSYREHLAEFLKASSAV